jgi:hypothetical protein
MPHYFTALFLFILCSCCTNPTTTKTTVSEQDTTNKDVVISNPLIVSTDNLADTSTDLTEDEYNLEDPSIASAYQAKDADFPSFNRNIIEAQLAQKVANEKPLVVHIFVPLCDNEHQGIVPTTASLGNGFSLRSNLYWATSTGMKRYFKEKKTWKLLKSIKNVYQDSVVLERVVFKRTYSNNAVVYLIADAYRGDKMLETVNHFLRAASNNYTEQLNLDNGTAVSIHGAADLVVFNGHNGLFDLYYNQPNRWYNSTNSQKDIAIIACYASEHFEREAMRAKAYPIVRAKGRLHPGAFVISGIIDKWAMLKSVEEMRLNAGKAYCKIHDCSIKTSQKLFYKGWRPENFNAPF